MLPRAVFADKKNEAACKHSGNCTHSQESFLHITGMINCTCVCVCVAVFIIIISMYSLVESYPLQQ